MLRVRRVAVLLSLSVLGAMPLAAQNLVVGTPAPATGNCMPWNCLGGPLGGTVYQQLYLASAFGGTRVNISGLYFFASADYNTFPGADFDGSFYRVSLSTVPTSPGGLVANHGPIATGGNDTNIFSGFISGPVPYGTALHFSFAPFLYDPAAGNLLMNVDLSQVSYPPNVQWFDMDVSCTQMARAFTMSSGAGADCAAPLVTGFDVSPVNSSVTPEPASLALLATGLAGVTAALRRRQRRRD